MTQDHQFVGADVHCPSCKEAMSAAVKCCTNCGSPITIENPSLGALIMVRFGRRRTQAATQPEVRREFDEVPSDCL